MLTFIEALDDSGMPFSYFPVMMPHASGDQVIAPTPVTETKSLCLCFFFFYKKPPNNTKQSHK